MQEMLLREDNYNNRFANGGVGKQKLEVRRAASSEQEIATWMLRRRTSEKAFPATKAAARQDSRQRATGDKA
jgi:hypothetical protein